MPLQCYYMKPSCKINFRDYSQSNIVSFQDNVELEFSRFDCLFENADESAYYTVDFFRNLLDKYFPVKNKTISFKRMQTPWITKKAKLCIDKKHLWSILAKQKIISDESYKFISRKVRELLHVAKTEYYSNKLHALRGNKKKIGIF